MTLHSVDDAYVGDARSESHQEVRRQAHRCYPALGRGWHKEAGLTTANIKAGDLLASTGVALRVLAMPSFMDNLPRQAPMIKAKECFDLGKFGGFDCLAPLFRIGTTSLCIQKATRNTDSWRPAAVRSATRANLISRSGYIFFIAGITGHVGGAAARRLLAEGKQVRTLLRTPEKAKAFADQGVKIQ